LGHGLVDQRQVGRHEGTIVVAQGGYGLRGSASWSLSQAYPVLDRLEGGDAYPIAKLHAQ
jgi:hypothetical protein